MDGVRDRAAALQPPPPARRSGGTEGNERLAAMTGMLLLTGL
jgi:hypothetical protein